MWPFRSPAPPPAAPPLRALSLLPPERARALGGLPPDAIAGTLPAGAPGPEQFQPNPGFVARLHAVIRAAGPQDPSMAAAARAQGEGWVYIIDLRTPDGPQGRVPPEDIIGGFQVSGGAILPESYWANAAHRVFTVHGLPRLGPFLEAALIEALAVRP